MLVTWRSMTYYTYEHLWSDIPTPSYFRLVEELRMLAKFSQIFSKVVKENRYKNTYSLFLGNLYNVGWIYSICRCALSPQDVLFEFNRPICILLLRCSVAKSERIVSYVGFVCYICAWKHYRIDFVTMYSYDREKDQET